ncbi:hypothetical protein CPB84DRAFT_1741689 [Gymnopilus junonius]|uniref:Uncharacterized protein n=1 Tax=Gymnopilus junonius TaxID=109634 RepID=A0A9P5NZ66_GYMJU|nr:hypothetical protein CPB84DRAFT_1741689 [Gymnopilus junonius]
MERPSKSENRLYSFLTSSRSRSRSKNEPAATPKPQRRPAASPGDPSKPPTRIQSRPLSSTTVTPSTPKASKRNPVVLNSPPPPVPLPPPTHKPSGTRQKLHDFFSIPLGRKSSRSRSRSRPNSPRPSLDVPPLPTAGLDDDSTPRPRKSYRPHSPRNRTPSPSPEPKILRVTNPTTSSTGSTAASIKISKFFSSKPNTPEPSLPNSKQIASGSGPPILPPIPSLVSGPLKHVSSLHRRSLKDPVDPIVAPKIMHTPPTPLKNTQNASSSARMVYHTAKGSLDSTYKYRTGTMGVVDEEGLTPTRAPSAAQNFKGKARQGKAQDHQPLSRSGLKTQLSSAARATKHGSFDFERPGWGASVMQRTGSNGTTNSGWSKNSDILGRERESTYGPGMAGVGTLQRELSMKRAQEREKMEKERTGDRRKEKERERPPTSERGTTPGSSNTPSEQHGSTSTNGTGPPNGKSSSMSRATGRRALFKTSSGTGVTRLIGLTSAQHPPFSFEPPVPSPTRSTGTASTNTAHEVPLSSSWNSKAEKERERVRDEKERLTSRKVGSLRRTGDRAPVPVPTVNGSPNYNAGHRSGTKGRSLDLGLGLAWAPSKVREEALDLLPNSAYFSRTASGSSHGHGMSRTASGSTNRTRSVSGQSGWEDDRGREVERSKLGREVAEVFKNALDPRDYKLFKAYVHQFDADEIPFDGPKGIVSLVERLLVNAPHLGDEGKRQLLDKFVRIILAQA